MDRDSFGSSRSISDKLQAEPVDETPASYFVEYPDGAKEIEPKNAKNELLFETDALDPDETELRFISQAYATVTDDGAINGGIAVEFWMDLNGGRARLTVGDEDTLVLEGDEKYHALRTVLGYFTDTDSIERDDPTYYDAHRRVETATDLHDFGISTLAERVRTHVVENFYDRYNADEERVVSVEGGVVIDDTFKVTYDAENYLIDDPGTYRIQSGDVVEVDETHQFIDVDFDTQDVRPMEMGGDTYQLTAREQAFLATIESLCYPERHLGVTMANRVERAVEGQDGDGIEEIAASGRVRAYKDEVAGLVHSHKIDKHTLTASFSVTQWVLDEMHFTEYDHAGVNELAAMESELRDADRDVFYDTDNSDDERWETIQQTAGNAQIHAHIQRKIDSLH